MRENIAYARPDATEEEVRGARRAGPGSHEFVAALPDGYDTLVGERGLTLSGGQRQRVAIARALVADPRILILDDATSSVDATTEAEIKDALREVMEGRTTFVIAHRLSTIALADEIVVLEEGEIVARGTHEELLEDSAALPRDRREGPARPGVPDRDPSSARWRGCEAAFLAARCAARTGARASCAACCSCCAPTAGAWSLMFVALLLATAASLVPPYLAGRAIDDGIRERRRRRAHGDR